MEFEKDIESAIINPELSDLDNMDWSDVEIEPLKKEPPVTKENGNEASLDDMDWSDAEVERDAFVTNMDQIAKFKQKQDLIKESELDFAMDNDSNYSRAEQRWLHDAKKYKTDEEIVAATKVFEESNKGIFGGMYYFDPETMQPIKLKDNEDPPIDPTNGVALQLFGANAVDRFMVGAANGAITGAGVGSLFGALPGAGIGAIAGGLLLGTINAFAEDEDYIAMREGNTLTDDSMLTTALKTFNNSLLGSTTGIAALMKLASEGVMGNETVFSDLYTMVKQQSDSSAIQTNPLVPQEFQSPEAMESLAGFFNSENYEMEALIPMLAQGMASGLQFIGAGGFVKTGIKLGEKGLAKASGKYASRLIAIEKRQNALKGLAKKAIAEGDDALAKEYLKQAASVASENLINKGSQFAAGMMINNQEVMQSLDEASGLTLRQKAAFGLSTTMAMGAIEMYGGPDAAFLRKLMARDGIQKAVTNEIVDEVKDYAGKKLTGKQLKKLYNKAYLSTFSKVANGLKTSLKGGFSEGGEELAQSAIQDVSKKFTNYLYDLDDDNGFNADMASPETWSEYFNSFIGGAITGQAMNVPASIKAARISSAIGMAGITESDTKKADYENMLKIQKNRKNISEEEYQTALNTLETFETFENEVKGKGLTRGQKKDIFVHMYEMENLIPGRENAETKNVSEVTKKKYDEHKKAVDEILAKAGEENPRKAKAREKRAEKEAEKMKKEAAEEKKTEAGYEDTSPDETEIPKEETKDTAPNETETSNEEVKDTAPTEEEKQPDGEQKNPIPETVTKEEIKAEKERAKEKKKDDDLTQKIKETDELIEKTNEQRNAEITEATYKTTKKDNGPEQKAKIKEIEKRRKEELEPYEKGIKEQSEMPHSTFKTFLLETSKAINKIKDTGEDLVNYLDKNRSFVYDENSPDETFKKERAVTIAEKAISLGIAPGWNVNDLRQAIKYHNRVAANKDKINSKYNKEIASLNESEDSTAAIEEINKRYNDQINSLKEKSDQLKSEQAKEREKNAKAEKIRSEKVKKAKELQKKKAEKEKRDKAEEEQYNETGEIPDPNAPQIEGTVQDYVVQSLKAEKANFSKEEILDENGKPRVDEEGKPIKRYIDKEGKKLTGITSVISKKLKNLFVAADIAIESIKRKIARNNGDTSEVDENHPRVKALLANWKYRTEEGTRVHGIAEHIARGKGEASFMAKKPSELDVAIYKELSTFIEGIKGQDGQILSELEVPDSEAGLMLIIDMIKVNPDGSIDIYDFKLNATGKGNRKAKETVYDGDEFKKGSPLEGVGSSKIKEHAIQLNMARRALERKGFKVNKTIIVPIEAKFSTTDAGGGIYNNTTSEVKIQEVIDVGKDISKKELEAIEDMLYAEGGIDPKKVTRKPTITAPPKGWTFGQSITEQRAAKRKSTNKVELPGRLNSQTELERIKEENPELAPVIDAILAKKKAMHTTMAMTTEESINALGESNSTLEGADLMTDVAIALEVVNASRGLEGMSRSEANSIMLHEEIHRYTTIILEIFNDSDPNSRELLSESELQFAEDLNSIWALYQQNPSKKFPQVHNIKEFIAYGLTDQEFIKELKSRTVNNKTLFDRVIDAIAKLFGSTNPDMHKAVRAVFDTFMKQDSPIINRMKQENHYAPINLNKDKSLLQPGETIKEFTDRNKPIGTGTYGSNSFDIYPGNIIVGKNRDKIVYAGSERIKAEILGTAGLVKNKYNPVNKTDITPVTATTVNTPKTELSEPDQIIINQLKNGRTIEGTLIEKDGQLYIEREKALIKVNSFKNKDGSKKEAGFIGKRVYLKLIPKQVWNPDSSKVNKANGKVYGDIVQVRESGTNTVINNIPASDGTSAIILKTTPSDEPGGDIKEGNNGEAQTTAANQGSKISSVDTGITESDIKAYDEFFGTGESFIDQAAENATRYQKAKETLQNSLKIFRSSDKHIGNKSTIAILLHGSNIAQKEYLKNGSYPKAIKKAWQAIDAIKEEMGIPITSNMKKVWEIAMLRSWNNHGTFEAWEKEADLAEQMFFDRESDEINWSVKYGNEEAKADTFRKAPKIKKMFESIPDVHPNEVYDEVYNFIHGYDPKANDIDEMLSAMKDKGGTLKQFAENITEIFGTEDFVSLVNVVRSSKKRPYLTAFINEGKGTNPKRSHLKIVNESKTTEWNLTRLINEFRKLLEKTGKRFTNVSAKNPTATRDTLWGNYLVNSGKLRALIKRFNASVKLVEVNGKDQWIYNDTISGKQYTFEDIAKLRINLEINLLMDSTGITREMAEIYLNNSPKYLSHKNALDFLVNEREGMLMSVRADGAPQISHNHQTEIVQQIFTKWVQITPKSKATPTEFTNDDEFHRNALYKLKKALPGLLSNGEYSNQYIQEEGKKKSSAPLSSSVLSIADNIQEVQDNDVNRGNPILKYWRDDVKSAMPIFMVSGLKDVSLNKGLSGKSMSDEDMMLTEYMGFHNDDNSILLPGQYLQTLGQFGDKSFQGLTPVKKYSPAESKAEINKIRNSKNPNAKYFPSKDELIKEAKAMQELIEGWQLSGILGTGPYSKLTDETIKQQAIEYVANYAINRYYLDQIFAGRMDNYGKQGLLKKLEVKNIFKVTPIQSADKKATVKASVSNKYIGYGTGIDGSSTEAYRQQIGEYANTGNYNADDTVFVSIGGKRGNEKIRKEQQDKTIKEALKAIEAGATLITDNKAYVESSNYNEGEKRLAKNLEAKGYFYSEQTINGQLLGIWNKENNSKKFMQTANSGRAKRSASFASGGTEIMVGIEGGLEETYTQAIFEDTKIAVILQIEDVSKQLDDEFENGDGIKFITEEHAAKYQVSAGTAFEIGTSVKDLYTDIDMQGNPIMDKCHTIVITKEMAAQNPNTLQPIYDMMNSKENGFDALIFDSGAKLYELYDENGKPIDVLNKMEFTEDGKFKSFGITPQQKQQSQHLISNTLSSEWKTLPVYSERGVNTMRTTNKEAEYAHFGNPFSEGGYSGTKRTKDVSTAIQAYKDWLKDDYIIYEDNNGVVQEIEEGYKKEQRQWILEQINSGKLDNKTLLYSEKLANKGLGSHAEALLEVIQEIRGIGSNIQSQQKQEAKKTPIKIVTRKSKNLRLQVNLNNDGKKKNKRLIPQMLRHIKRLVGNDAVDNLVHEHMKQKREDYLYELRHMSEQDKREFLLEILDDNENNQELRNLLLSGSSVYHPVIEKYIQSVTASNLKKSVLDMMSKGSLLTTISAMTIDAKLKGPRIENGVVKPGQVMVAEGSGYKKRDKLFITRMPASGLQLIGYVEVVGFLPASAGNKIVIDEVTKKLAGEDLDGDQRHLWAEDNSDIARYLDPSSKTAQGKLIKRNVLNSKYNALRNLFGNDWKYFAGNVNEIFKESPTFDFYQNPSQNLSQDTYRRFENDLTEHAKEFFKTNEAFYFKTENPISGIHFGKKRYKLKYVNSPEAIVQKLFKMTQEAYENPANFDKYTNPVDTKRLDGDLKPDEMADANPYLPTTSAIIYNANKSTSGSDSVIGIVAKSMASLIEMSGNRLTINGRKYDDYKGNLNNIFQLLDDALNQSTDNAKEQKLHRMNLNNDNAGLWMSLAISGYNIKEIIDYMDTPFVKEYHELVKKQKLISDQGITDNENSIKLLKMVLPGEEPGYTIEGFKEASPRYKAFKNLLDLSNSISNFGKLLNISETGVASWAEYEIAQQTLNQFTNDLELIKIDRNSSIVQNTKEALKAAEQSLKLFSNMKTKRAESIIEYVQELVRPTSKSNKNIEEKTKPNKFKDSWTKSQVEELERMISQLIVKETFENDYNEQELLELIRQEIETLDKEYTYFDYADFQFDSIGNKSFALDSSLTHNPDNSFMEQAKKEFALLPNSLQELILQYNSVKYGNSYSTKGGGLTRTISYSKQIEFSKRIEKVIKRWRKDDAELTLEDKVQIKKEILARPLLLRNQEIKGDQATVINNIFPTIVRSNTTINPMVSELDRTGKVIKQSRALDNKADTFKKQIIKYQIQRDSVKQENVPTESIDGIIDLMYSTQAYRDLANAIGGTRDQIAGRLKDPSRLDSDPKDSPARAAAKIKLRMATKKFWNAYDDQVKPTKTFKSQDKVVIPKVIKNMKIFGKSNNRALDNNRKTDSEIDAEFVQNLADQGIPVDRKTLTYEDLLQKFSIDGDVIARDKERQDKGLRGTWRDDQYNYHYGQREPGNTSGKTVRIYTGTIEQESQIDGIEKIIEDLEEELLEWEVDTPAYDEILKELNEYKEWMSNAKEALYTHIQAPGPMTKSEFRDKTIPQYSGQSINTMPKIAQDSLNKNYNKYVGEWEIINNTIMSSTGILSDEQSLNKHIDEQAKKGKTAAETVETLIKELKRENKTIAAEFAIKILNDRLVKEQIVEGIRNEANGRIRGRNLYTRALYDIFTILENQNEDWGSSELESGKYAIKSPSRVFEAVLQLNEDLLREKVRSAEIESKDLRDKLTKIYQRIKDAGTDIKELIYDDPKNNVQYFHTKNSIEYQNLKTKAKAGDKGAEALIELYDLHVEQEKLTGNYSYDAKEKAYRVPQQEADILEILFGDFNEKNKSFLKNLLKSDNLIKTFKSKISSQSYLDDIYVGTDQFSGLKKLGITGVQTFGEAKEALLSQITPAKNIFGQKKNIQILRKLRSLQLYAEELNSKGIDDLGAPTKMSGLDKINPKLGFEKSDTTTTNIAAAISRHHEGMIFKKNLETIEPTMSFLEDHLERVGMGNMKNWLNLHNRKVLYNENPESNVKKYEKIIDGLASYTYAKMLGLNWVGAVFNGGQGFVRSFTEMKVKALSRGIKRIVEQVGTSNPTNAIVNNRAIKVLNLFNVVSVSKDTEMNITNKTLNKASNFAFMNITIPEYLNHAYSFIGTMESYEWDAIVPLVDSGGSAREVTIAIGRALIENDNTLTSSGLTGKQLEDMEFLVGVNRINELQEETQRMNGSYHPSSKRMYNSTAEGRFLMMFKNWIPETYLAHLSPEFNDIYGRNRKGFVNSAVDLVKKLHTKEGWEALSYIVRPGANAAEGYDKLSKVDQDNIQKLVKEVLLLGVTALTSVALFGYDDDDDLTADQKKMRKHLDRLMSDSAYFYNPESYTDLISKPFPAAQSLEDIVKMSYSLITLDKYKASNDRVEKGDYKIGHFVEKNIPLWNQSANTVRNLSDTFNYVNE